MGFGRFVFQREGLFFLCTCAAKADTICRRLRFFFFSRAFFLVIARNFSELGDFYYFFVFRNHNLPANQRQLAARCICAATRSKSCDQIRTKGRDAKQAARLQR